jgi:methylated-DNA-[protein]-cysteine S-methyltransferase
MKKSFSECCYTLLNKVPRGKVVSYGQIAHALGTRAYRAVGTAMNRNPYASKVQCHRVINSDGRLGGFGSGVEEKKKLLQSEGVIIKEGKIDFKKYGYSFVD